jgi:GT2 family glycosyltransferase/glycosyltransferase involved in cell wall biosynthesis
MSGPHVPLPRVRVVVLNWNSAWLTARCLRSLVKTDYPADRFEVVVVDNASLDGSRQRLEHDFPELRHVANPSNLGFAEGCNRAMRDREGIDHIALVNNDAVVRADWLRPLVDALEADPDAGAACPMMSLEMAFVPIHLTPNLGDGEPTPVLERVLVDGLDVTRRILSDDLAMIPDQRWPLEFVREVRETATLEVPVPADGSPVEVTLQLSTPGSNFVVAGAEGTWTDSAGETRTGVARSTGPGDRRVNSLGTRLTDVLEGEECGFGDPLPLDRAPREVWGWCGGGVLLRGRMLDDVGVFDPKFFAYYEDTDLAWRSSRKGWHTVCVPKSEVIHLHGGSAGSTARPFFFLNYRNWMLTVERNGTGAQRSMALRQAGRWTRSALRRNITGRLRRGWRPYTELAVGWLRVQLGFWAARFRVRFGRRGVVGTRPADDVRSGLMPPADIPTPTRRVGGPRLVYVDVTETVRSGWRAGIQRVTCELVRYLPTQRDDLEVIPVVWSTAREQFRRVTSDEYDSLLTPTGRQVPHGPGRTQPRWRQVAGRVGRAVGLQPMAEGARRRKELREEPDDVDQLVIDRFETRSIFFDCDASWNTRGAERAVVLPRLARDGVTIVEFLHDVLPVMHPEWFERTSARRFTEHVESHARQASHVIANSADTARTYDDWRSAKPQTTPPVTVVPLGTEMPVPRDQGLAKLPSVLEGQRYALVVGTIEPRKNHAAVFAAYDELHEDYGDLHLVVVGREGWKAGDLVDRLRRHASTDDHVHWMHEANDEELSVLYRHAFVVVVASFAEGFGLPVAEALGHGVAVISSDGGALPEAGGEAVEYFDPNDPPALASLLRTHLDDPDHHAERVRVAQTLEPRRWAVAASEVGAVLASVPLRS